MSALVISAFGGIAPAVDERNLPNTGAVRASNLVLRYGDFRPCKTDSAVASSGVSNPKTLYRFQRKSVGGFNSNPATGWTVRAGEVDFVRGQILEDENERTYYTGEGAPKATDLSGVVRTLGVPAAIAAPESIHNVVDEFTVDESAELVGLHVVSLREAVMNNLDHEYLAPSKFFGMYARAAYNGMEDVAGVIVKRVPALKDVAGAYSLADSANFSWVLDPTIDSFWFDLPGAGASLGVPLRYGGPVKYLSAFTDRTDLDQVTHPLTGDPLLDASQEASLREWVNALLDPLNPKLVAAKEKLTAIGEQFSALLDNSHSAAQKAAVDDFYASASVGASLSSAGSNLATSIAGYVASIYHYHQSNYVSPP